MYGGPYTLVGSNNATAFNYMEKGDLLKGTGEVCFKHVAPLAHLGVTCTNDNSANLVYACELSVNVHESSSSENEETLPSEPKGINAPCGINTEGEDLIESV